MRPLLGIIGFRTADIFPPKKRERKARKRKKINKKTVEKCQNFAHSLTMMAAGGAEDDQ